MAIRRVHITGGPGGGKTTLPKQIAASLNSPCYELDAITLRPSNRPGKPFSEMANEALRIAESDRWVSDGAFFDWTEPLFRHADLVVWLDLPWRVASYRILSRHIRATIARDNPFPGWRSLWRFWRWSRRYYHDQVDGGLNEWGTPITRRTTASLLEPYERKLKVCRTTGDIAELLTNPQTDSDAD